jgi:hypothetical protein
MKEGRKEGRREDVRIVVVAGRVTGGGGFNINKLREGRKEGRNEERGKVKNGKKGCEGRKD